jgi:hypothetical protein
MYNTFHHLVSMSKLLFNSSIATDRENVKETCEEKRLHDMCDSQVFECSTH